MPAIAPRRFNEQVAGYAPAESGPVVLWEDDPVRRPLLAAILEAAGLAVAQPGNADSALELAARNRAGVLVLDANVTQPSGAEFLRELRHRSSERATPTVALLQPGQACLRRTVLDLGVQRVVHEPFTPEELIAAVRGLQPRMERPL